MPVVLGVLSLLALAASAGLIVRILDISHPASVIIASGLVVSYPVTACVFSYMFAADGYFFALLLSVLSVYLTKKYRWGWIPAIGCIVVSLGGYQAFIG